MPQQGDAFLKSIFADERFQSSPLRTLTRNQTLQPHASCPKLGARAQQKCMILDLMQPAYGHECYFASSPERRSSIDCACQCDPQSRNLDLACVDRRVMLQNVTAVVIGYCETETARLQLCV